MSDILEYLAKSEDKCRFIKERLLEIENEKINAKQKSGVFGTKSTINKCNQTNKESISESKGEINVTIIGNVHNWYDKHSDVLITGSADKTLKNKDEIYVLKNHLNTTDGVIGKNNRAYVEDVALTDLGVLKDGNTEVLMFNNQIYQDFDKKIYQMYDLGLINQHSIGLFYKKIFTCLNDSESGKLYENWNKYIELVINKEKAIENGYFWAVAEYELIEVSSVLWGANELTYTREVSKSIEKESNENKYKFKI